jgi:hypothetical protein
MFVARLQKGLKFPDAWEENLQVSECRLLVPVLEVWKLQDQSWKKSMSKAHAFL